jgi:hypothetical protein
MIVPPLTKKYRKISTIVVFDASRISQWRSTGGSASYEIVVFFHFSETV